MRRSGKEPLQHWPRLLHPKQQLLKPLFLLTWCFSISCFPLYPVYPSPQHVLLPVASGATATAATCMTPCLLKAPPAFLVSSVDCSASGCSRRGNLFRTISRAAVLSSPSFSYTSRGYLGHACELITQQLPASRLSPLPLVISAHLLFQRSYNLGGSPCIKSIFGGSLGLVMRAHINRSHSRLGRPQAHRKALLRSLATQLIRHGSIITTAAKGKELCRLIDSKLLLAKKGGLHNYRQALGFFYDKKLTRELFRQAPQRFSRRNSGFCRRTRLPFPRLGDAAKICRVDLID